MVIRAKGLRSRGVARPPASKVSTTSVGQDPFDSRCLYEKDGAVEIAASKVPDSWMRLSLLTQNSGKVYQVSDSDVDDTKACDESTNWILPEKCPMPVRSHEIVKEEVC